MAKIGLKLQQIAMTTLKMPKEASDFQSSLRDVLLKLRKHPTFAMSLGAKELFHSNFLAYLLESREPGLSFLQHRLRELLGCPCTDGEESWCLVFRELRSLDLVVVPVRRTSGSAFNKEALTHVDYLPSRNRCSVVEMKMKALPTEEQLLRYTEILQPSKGKPATFPFVKVNGDEGRAVICPKSSNDEPLASLRLVTVDGRSIKTSGKHEWVWQGVSWSNIAHLIKGSINAESRRLLGSRVADIILDYAESLEKLLAVVDATELLYRGARNLPYLWFIEQMTSFEELRAARISDLVGKRAFAHWLEDICKSFPKQTEASPNLGGPTSEVFLSRGTPGLTLQWHFQPYLSKNVKLRIGVQIQGGSYRHFVAGDKKWADLEEFVVKSGLVRAWFGASVNFAGMASPLFGKASSKICPVVPSEVVSSERRTNLLVFHKDQFLYSQCGAIEKGATLADIEKAIHESMALASRLKQKL